MLQLIVLQSMELQSWDEDVEDREEDGRGEVDGAEDVGGVVLGAVRLQLPPSPVVDGSKEKDVASVFVVLGRTVEVELVRKVVELVSASVVGTSVVVLGIDDEFALAEDGDCGEE